jgi:hypothetical protein
MSSIKHKGTIAQLMNAVFHHATVVQAAGLPRTTVLTWAHRNVVAPTSGAQTGTGNRRMYSFLDVCRLAVTAEVMQLGVRAAKAAALARCATNDVLTEAFIRTAITNERISQHDGDVWLLLSNDGSGQFRATCHQSGRRAAGEDRDFPQCEHTSIVLNATRLIVKTCQRLNGELEGTAASGSVPDVSLKDLHDTFVAALERARSTSATANIQRKDNAARVSDRLKARM